MRKLIERIIAAVAAEARIPVAWWGTDKAPERPAAHLCDWRCWVSCKLGDHARLQVTEKCRCCLTKAFSYEMEIAAGASYPDKTTKWWDAEPWTPPIITAEMRAAYDANPDQFDGLRIVRRTT